jgi:hypothetical protein
MRIMQPIVIISTNRLRFELLSNSKKSDPHSIAVNMKDNGD